MSKSSSLQLHSRRAMMYTSFFDRNHMKNISNSKISELDLSDIYSFWPMGFSPRDSQIKVLEWIKKLPSHIKYILCEVPVGGGKSPIALSLSGWFAQSLGNSYILTPQRVLQKQYEDSFHENLIHPVYGKSNYKCESKSTNCELGSEIKPRCVDCPHREAYQKIQHTPNAVMNYTLAFLLFKYNMDEKIISKRDLIVFDEAHTIETHLTEFNAISISEMRCRQLGTVAFKQHTKMSDALTWIKDVYMPSLRNKIAKLTPQVQEILDSCSEDSRSPTKDELNTISLCKELTNHKEMIHEQLLMVPVDDIYRDYVMVNEGKAVFKFKELFGKRNFKRFVDPMAERFLFMSSTILDKDEYCSDLGIDPAQAAFISLDSEFDEANRPIYYIPTTKMTFGWDKPDRKKDADRMISRIKSLCNDVHGDDNGIIHTGSFQIAKWLVERLDGHIPHMIYHHNPGSGFTRDEVLEDFQKDDGIRKILISPSITEGLDLKDDKGRFAIFAKVPYPFLGDAWVKARQNLSSDWYKRQALIAMIQGGGRVVRSGDDYGSVYILDSSFNQLLSNSRHMVPKWWEESIQIL